MSQTLLAPMPIAASVSLSPDVLDAIVQPECNLAIWQRAPLPGLAAFLDVAVSEIRFTAPLVALSRQLERVMDDAGYPQGPARGHFVADVAQLAGIFARLCKLSAITLRLEIVTGDACRKWHADYVAARLITTNAGRGTQWIDGRDAIRVKQGEEPVRIHSLGTGDVGIFKGRLATDTPAIHRSPPISHTGEKRLVLVLNPPEEA